MIAAAVATILLVFVFVAFVIGLRYGWTHAVPKGAVNISEIGLKDTENGSSFWLMGHDGWVYEFRQGMPLYLLPSGEV